MHTVHFTVLITSSYDPDVFRSYKRQKLNLFLYLINLALRYEDVTVSVV
jgi:hypothetical protein